MAQRAIIAVTVVIIAFAVTMVRWPLLQHTGAADSAQHDLQQVHVLPKDSDVSELEATPRGPRNDHCGEVGHDKGAAHARCPFRRGTRSCDRLVVDGFASPEEVRQLLELAQAAMGLGKHGLGGVTLVDMAHGIVSYERQFGHLFKLAQRKRAAGVIEADSPLLSEAHLKTYEAVVERIRHFVIDRFLSEDTAVAVQMAKPAFVSRITNATAAIPNDEYWHVHVDTDQYGVFDVTTLLYLSDFVVDPADATDEAFAGGTFDFVDAEADGDVTDVLAVPPEKGRLLMFTSGPEHPHRVAPVQSGVRYAMTTAFSCSADIASSSRVLDALREALRS